MSSFPMVVWPNWYISRRERKLKGKGFSDYRIVTNVSTRLKGCKEVRWEHFFFFFSGLNWLISDSVRGASFMGFTQHLLKSQFYKGASRMLNAVQ